MLKKLKNGRRSHTNLPAKNKLLLGRLKGRTNHWLTSRTSNTHNVDTAFFSIEQSHAVLANAHLHTFVSTLKRIGLSSWFIGLSSNTNYYTKSKTFHSNLDLYVHSKHIHSFVLRLEKEAPRQTHLRFTRLSLYGSRGRRFIMSDSGAS